MPKPLAHLIVDHLSPKWQNRSDIIYQVSQEIDPRTACRIIENHYKQGRLKRKFASTHAKVNAGKRHLILKALQSLIKRQRVERESEDLKPRGVKDVRLRLRDKNILQFKKRA